MCCLHVCFLSVAHDDLSHHHYESLFLRHCVCVCCTLPYHALTPSRPPRPPRQVLRLLCLQSLANNGIKAKQFDQLRREVLQTYGCELIFTMDNLEKLGLFKPYSRRGPGLDWPAMRKQFKLLEEEVEVSKPTSIAYVSSGYAPLSCRIVECFMQRGWRAMAELVRPLPGPQAYINQSHSLAGGGDGEDAGAGAGGAGGGGAAAGAGGDDLSRMSLGKKKVMVVFFVGGVTFMEISALRLLSLRDDCPFEIIVATTKLINGNTLMKTLLHDVENKLIR